MESASVVGRVIHNYLFENFIYTALMETKDSGSRRSFDTGSVRDAATGKGRYDLVTPIGLQRVAQLYERGAQKYAARNWEKGQPVTVFFDCAMRHMQKHLMGYRDEDHLAAAAWNILGIMHVEHQAERGKLPASLVDWPDAYVTEQDVGGPVFKRPQEYGLGVLPAGIFDVRVLDKTPLRPYVEVPMPPPHNPAFDHLFKSDGL